MLNLEVVCLAGGAHGEHVVAGRKRAVSHEKEAVAVAILADDGLGCAAIDMSVEPRL